MLKFLHAADLHLDSPLHGLERYEGAPVEKIRAATRRALENLVNLAIDEKVDFILLAGDLYDGDWRDFSTGLFLVRQLARLQEADIPVIALAGNHDAANKMTKSLSLPKNAKFLSAKKPETFELEDLGVAVHGQGFANPAVWEDLSHAYPAPRRGLFNIGLLHTCATCSDGHERYAPCTVEGLRNKGYDYWALGHIHKRQILHPDPPIAFPGNLQGRHIREEGPKGCLLVTVTEGETPAIEFRPLDVVRWQRCVVTAANSDTPDCLFDRASEYLKKICQDPEPPLWAVRVEFTGNCRAHGALQAEGARWTNELRARTLALADDRLWLEKVLFRTNSDSKTTPPILDGPFEELALVLNQLRENPEKLRALADSLAELKRKLPADLFHGDPPLDPTDPAWLQTLLDQVEPILRQRLFPQEALP